MKRLTLYDKYRKNVLKFGGELTEEDDAKLGAVSSLALMGGQAMGDKPSLGKGALTGVGTGLSIGKNFGPMGAAIGAGAGLLIGGLKGALDAKKMRREEELANITMKTKMDMMDMNRSGARLGLDPTLATGDADASFFVHGGELPGGDSTRLFNRKSNIKGYTPEFTEIERYKGKGTIPGARNNKALFNYMNTPSNNGKLNYTGVVGPDDIQINNPTPYQSIFTAGNYYQKNTTELGTQSNNMRNPSTAPQSTLSSKLRAKMNVGIDTAPVTYAANGGSLKAPLSTLMMKGGSAKSLSKNNTEFVGNSHAQGGIDLPIGAEVESKETTMDDYVFSDKLGFAALHKPIATAKGKIESKPATSERVNSLRLLMGREKELQIKQEMVKQQLNLS